MKANERLKFCKTCPYPSGWPHFTGEGCAGENAVGCLGDLKCCREKFYEEDVKRFGEPDREKIDDYNSKKSWYEPQ